MYLRASGGRRILASETDKVERVDSSSAVPFAPFPRSTCTSRAGACGGVSMRSSVWSIHPLVMEICAGTRWRRTLNELPWPKLGNFTFQRGIQKRGQIAKKWAGIVKNDNLWYIVSKDLSIGHHETKCLQKNKDIATGANHVPPSRAGGNEEEIDDVKNREKGRKWRRQACET